MGLIIGIDPGLDGGVALMTASDGLMLRAFPMPTKGLSKGKRDVDVSALNRDFDWQTVDLVVVERATAMPKQGTVSMFTFGRGYGKILGLIEAVGVPMEEPTPQRWKGVVLTGTTRDKEAAIAYVQRRFPHLSLLASPKCRTPHNGMADAICIAEYGRRLLTGQVDLRRRK